MAASSPAISMVSGIADTLSAAPIAKGDMASLIQDSLHFVFNGDGSVALFDLARDPLESNALAPEAHPLAMERLRMTLGAVWTGRSSLAKPIGRRRIGEEVAPRIAATGLNSPLDGGARIAGPSERPPSPLAARPHE
jgi:hypothetical protein